MQEYEWFVMDGRARFDTESAAVFEACGNKEPSNKSLRKDWGDMDAVLVRAQVTAKDSTTGDVISCGDFEYVRDI